MLSWLERRWPEIIGISIFATLLAASLILPNASPPLSATRYATDFNAALSIGTGGMVSFLFYYLVNERSDRRRRKLLQSSVQKTYRDAKWNIAVAVIQASVKGGRSDLTATSDTIDQAVTAQGFKLLFSGGREANEGYYAFENEMTSETPEYNEIIFNLKVIARATERLIDNGAVDDRRTYNFFVRLGTLVGRIEKSGPGYDESKPLCSFIWEMFTGWSFIDGDVGYDRIERAIDRLRST